MSLVFEVLSIHTVVQVPPLSPPIVPKKSMRNDVVQVDGEVFISTGGWIVIWKSLSEIVALEPHERALDKLVMCRKHAKRLAGLVCIHLVSLGETFRPGSQHSIV